MGSGGAELGLPFLSRPLLSAEPIPFPSYRSSLGFQPAFWGDESLRVMGPVSLISLNLRVRKSLFNLCFCLCGAEIGWSPSTRRILTYKFHTSGWSQVSQFCRFETSFRFKALCFGLSTAPHVFPQVLAPVSVFLIAWVFACADS